MDPEGGGPASGGGGVESTASGVPPETFGSWDLEFPPQISGNTLLSAADPAVNSSSRTLLPSDTFSVVWEHGF